MLDATNTKGFIAKRKDVVYYTDGENVYWARETTIPDICTGYPQGRWECSIQHFRRFREACYDITLEELEAALKNLKAK